MVGYYIDRGFLINARELQMDKYYLTLVKGLLGINLLIVDKLNGVI
jgi:hypothetical protein